MPTSLPLPSPLTTLTSALSIPEEYARYEHLASESPDSDTLLRLDEWKTSVPSVLLELQTRLDQSPDSLNVEDQACVIARTAQFDGSDPWISERSRDLASAILTPLPPSLPLLESILSHHIKPIFRSNPHPSLNLSTGRKLPRPAGGPLAAQDYYEGQVWKRHPGVGNVVEWVVRHVESDMYERLWHLLIPPIMTLLDDYELKHKLRGVQIVSSMLDRAPPDLLKRTGIDGLIFTSLKSTLTHLHDPLSPALLLASIPTSLKLIAHTTTKGSKSHHELTCEVLGEGIIGGVWAYAGREGEVVEASVCGLGGVLREMGVGAVRYLKALIPQLTHPLHPNPLAPPRARRSLELASVEALIAVIRACAPRMYNWRGTILDAVGRRWVAIVDAGEDDEDSVRLKRGLMGVVEELARACPSVVEDEYPRFKKTDTMFNELFAFIPIESEAGIAAVG